MRTLPATLLSLSIAPMLACGGSGGPARSGATAELPPIADCGRTIDALVPVLETPAVVLVGDPAAHLPQLVGDLACQVAAGGKAVVVAIEPGAAEAAGGLQARVDGMRAAGLEVVIAREALGTVVARVSAEQPEARLIAYADSVDDLAGVSAYAINVVGDAASASPAPVLRTSAAREGGFDAVLDLTAPAAEAPAAEAPAAEAPAAPPAAEAPTAVTPPG